MFDVSTFLMRWLFLSNLSSPEKVAEIQTLPCHQYYPHQHLENIAASLSPQRAEEIWRDHCVKGILSYPPGMQRLYMMDALRVELVKQLAQKLEQSDATLKHVAKSRQMAQGEDTERRDDEEESDLDADSDILNEFGARASTGMKPSEPMTDQRAKLVISPQHSSDVVLDKSETPDPSSDVIDVTRTTPNHNQVPPTERQVLDARRNLRQAREYLPQLVSAVLRSPPAFDENLSNPVQRLRQLMLKRCLQDPSWGIELCWLLEADVGRAWKTLFEHRQQTGRRLIVVLPADKAQVLQKIGSEKREAFDLLQDAEQATAYGYTSDPALQDEPSNANCQVTLQDARSRLPSSLSMRRCSHFGDTMHLVDRLSKISLDLRMVPVLQRKACLHEALHELNRRLRRRMVTRGDISLDVEDSRSPYDWPQIDDLTLDQLQHSVHFPLIPQTELWPDGDSSREQHNGRPQFINHIVRVLNIVVPESRLLASRERCPFLVHMEVVDTNLEGGDAKLYAAGVGNLGSTIGEALGMCTPQMSSEQTPDAPSYSIPDELATEMQRQEGGRDTLDPASASVVNQAQLPRGGSQAENFWVDGEDGTGYLNADPYEDFRQREYEQLHQQMHYQQPTEPPPPQMQMTVTRRSLSTGMELLDKVFGPPWKEKCKEIRATSPYGHVKGWRLASFIMKAGEDIRKEALVMQIISKLRTWFQEDIPESDRPFMRPYTIMCVGGDAGLLECLSDAKSIDEVKKRIDGFTTLRQFFERAYGPPGSQQSTSPPGRGISFEVAQDNFLRSLVGYSLVCYILQIKDRHNANILLDREGHIMHIDFGFVLGETPKMGKVPLFSERAPFKLSGEFWDVLGGWNLRAGGLGAKFCRMFEKAFECASMHSDEIATLVEGIVLSLGSTPRHARNLANGVRKRLLMRGPPSSNQQQAFIMDLVNAALTSWGTSTYDWLQRNMNGYQ